MVVWSDDLEQIVPLCNSFDNKLMKFVLQPKRHNHTPSIVTSPSNSSVPSATGSNVNLTEKIQKAIDNTVTLSELVDKEKEESNSETPAALPTEQSKGWGWRLSPKKTLAETSSDEEKGSGPQARPIRLFGPFYIGAGAGLALCEFYVLFTCDLDIWTAGRFRCLWCCFPPARMAIGQKLLPFRSSCHHPFHPLHFFSEFTIFPR